MKYLIDADTLCYAAAVVTEDTSPDLAKWETNTSVERLLREIDATDFDLYITGENNFRYAIYPEYKAQRLKIPRPTFLEVCKRTLINEWGAVLSDGCEADDLLGIRQTQEAKAGRESCIVSIDKDLDQIPGWHYNPGIKRFGSYIKEPRRYAVGPVDGMRFFYYQLLVGDTADNIKGAAGIGPKKAGPILDGLTDDYELYNAVRNHYSSDEELEMNAQVLWIWKKLNDRWEVPIAV